MDLSYRAQLNGWRFVFLPQLTCPAELPTSMTAFKTQQHRWAKGTTQVMLKLLPTIWRADVPWAVKLEATFHLAGNIAFVLMTINAIFFLIPGMVFRRELDFRWILFLDGPIFVLASWSFVTFYLTAQHALFASVKGSIKYVPCLMALGIGMGVNNSRAVLEALMGKHSEFVRTPKHGVSAIARDAPSPGGQRRYRSEGGAWGIPELVLGLFYSAAAGWAAWTGLWVSVPFLMLFQVGFLFVGLATLADRIDGKRGQVPDGLEKKKTMLPNSGP